jgi:dolichol-phosphate mannosyltransferase
MDVSVVVPTFNEAGNVEELVARIEASVRGLDAEIVFVDDSTDQTPGMIGHAAALAALSVRLVHRDDPVGGLSGAVVEGIERSSGTWVVVMDGDLQHPPELIPVLIQTGELAGADVVAASRHASGGSAEGLNGRLRAHASNAATLLARGMFPTRLRMSTDPMTGFFAVRHDRLDLSLLRPRGFKILLEILISNDLALVEVPFVFGRRTAGRSKAGVGQGVRFLAQLAALRFGSRRVAVRGLTAATVHR